jgi:CheY-like chemotaxis protein
MNILLVEDDIVSQKLATTVLTKWGLEVTSVADGQEAIDALQEKHYQLVLMDIQMPGMDGLEATALIRSMADPYFQNLPILAYTNSIAIDSKEKALEAGMNDFIAKPLDAPELHCKINEHLLRTILDPRPLSLRFSAYTEGPAMKVELVDLMLSNLNELQRAVYKTYYTNDVRFIQSAYNKVKSTLLLLDDREYMYVIEDLKDSYVHGLEKTESQTKIRKFDRLTHSIIKTLDTEKTAV